MKKFKFLSLFLIFCILACALSPLGAYALEEPSIHSDVAMVVDRATGEVFYSKNADWKIYPASTTKIMTVMLAIEAIERGEATLSDEVTASANMSFDLIAEGSSADIQIGETMTLENLLYCAMLASGNDACNVIAEYIGGTVSDFVALMNSRARALGCTDTNFTNTHGLPDENHYTTAQDFCLIAQAAAGLELLMDISNTASVTIPATNLSGARVLNSTNALITDSSIYGAGYLYEFARGIKTGHTNDAGYCLVSTALQNDIDIMALVFGGKAYEENGAQVIDSFRDSVTLYNWVFENFSYQNILTAGDVVKSVAVELGSDADSIALSPSKSLTALLPNDFNPSEFIKTITVYSELEGEALSAPIKAGEVLGEISVSRGDINYGTVKLVAASGVSLSYKLYMKQTVVQTLKSPLVITIIVVILLLVAAYIFIVVRYRMKRRKYTAALKQRRAQQAASSEEAPVQAKRSAAAAQPTPPPAQVKKEAPAKAAVPKQAAKAEAPKPSAPEKGEPADIFLDAARQSKRTAPAAPKKTEPRPSAQNPFDISLDSGKSAAPNPFDISLDSGKADAYDPFDISLDEGEGDMGQFALPLDPAPAKKETVSVAAGETAREKTAEKPAKKPDYIDIRSLEEKAQRDYFEEFFRQK